MIGTALSKYPSLVPSARLATKPALAATCFPKFLCSNANNVSQPKAKTAARTRISAGKMRLMRRE